MFSRWDDAVFKWLVAEREVVVGIPCCVFSTSKFQLQSQKPDQCKIVIGLE